MIRLVVLLPLLTIPIVGQNPVAYPQDSTGISSGNLTPLGFSSSSGNIDEGRYQILIPASHLPSTGGAITGLSVVSTSSSMTAVYTSLQITLSHTTATSLSATFASNLPSPMVVLNVANTGFSFVQRQWSTVPFTTQFVYDGVSNLVIDFQKVYDRVANPPPTLLTHQTTGNPGRTDLPGSRYNFGVLGSGASTSTTAPYTSVPLMVRLLVVGIPTMTLKSDRGGPNNNVFAVGQSFDLNVHANSGSLFIALLGDRFNAPPAPLGPILGLFWVSGVTLKFASVGASGVDTTTIPIPGNSGLVGFYLTAQCGVLDSASMMPFWTCAADTFIRS